jgi:uncharacterized RDD family membrane protein YckC
MLDIGRDAMTMALPEHVSIVSAVLRPLAAHLGPIAGSRLRSVPVAQRTTSSGDPAVVDPPASLARRFGALLVDWILCLLAAGVFADPRRDAWAAPVVLIVEYTVFLGFFAQTPGMWMARIRCVAIEGGGRLGPLRAALRGALLCLVVPALIMKDGRGLHDRMAGSVVLDGPPPRN